MKSLWLGYGFILFLLIIDNLDSAAVPKGGAGSGGRGVKGMVWYGNRNATHAQ